MENKNESNGGSSKFFMVLVLVLFICICMACTAACCFVMFFNTVTLKSIQNKMAITNTSEDSKIMNPETTNQTLPDSNGSSTTESKSMTFASQTLYFSVTDLDISTGAVLVVEVQSASGQTLKKSSEFNFAPSDVGVDSLGNASLEYNVDSFKYLSSDAPLKLKLFEVLPDSLGKPHQYEISSQTIVE